VMECLPQSSSLRVDLFSSLFHNTTGCHKHLFFHAILERLRHEPRKEDPQDERGIISIQLDKIGADMIEYAFPSVSYWHLNLGYANGVEKCIEELKLRKDRKQLTAREKKEIRNGKGPRIIKECEILDDVPYKMLSPWMKEQKIDLSGGSPHVGKVYEKSTDLFDEIKPLYRTHEPRATGEDRCIMMHGEWVNYIVDNYEIVRRWADYHWLKFLQSRNPNVPSLVNKLWTPDSKRNLAKYRKKWQEAFDCPPTVDCIYTEALVALRGEGKAFHLDHFLPRSWVEHDQFWNLAPVSRNINQKKSNQLPHKDYIKNLASLHCEAMERLSHHMREKAENNRTWERICEEYIDGLGINPKTRFSYSDVMQAYADVFISQMELAEKSGFAASWRPNGGETESLGH